MADRYPDDTIAARATPAGRGGVAIIRVSGPHVVAIARALLGSCPEPRRAALRSFRSATGEAIDSGLALYFPAPNSYTGEDVLELHGHGGPVVSEMLLERVLELGARLANPGEFTQRAFLNDRLDLLQAEAVADLIDSGTRAAARAAQRSLQGALSARVTALSELLTDLRVHVEAAIDFPDEDIDFLADAGLIQKIDAVAGAFGELERTVRQGRLVRDGVQVVLAGPPNSGKSSLLNVLAGVEAAIVAPVPGTTRDVIREHLEIDGLPVTILDTAGLREPEGPVEAEGVRRTRRELRTADLILLVSDASAEGETDNTFTDELPPDTPVIRVRNKIDLTGEAPGVPAGDIRLVRISALSGAGLPHLRAAIRQAVGHGAEEGTVTARRRHVEALAQARQHFEAGRAELHENRAGELLAEELREAQHCLAAIVGEFSADDLLGEIFSRFCIGK